jgi:hypothetical protein
MKIYISKLSFLAFGPSGAAKKINFLCARAYLLGWYLVSLPLQLSSLIGNSAFWLQTIPIYTCG